MRMLCKKLISTLLTLTLLLTLAPAALAEGTQLQVTLSGLYATRDGTYLSVAVDAVFDVYQDEQKVGVLNVTADGPNTIDLDSNASVRLAPVEGSYPAELPLNAYGYGVRISEGRLNIAPIQVKAEAGLFTLEAGQQAAFVLLNDLGESVLAFQTDEAGFYALDVAIPAGNYTLRMTDAAAAMWPDQAIEIQTYSDADSVLKLCAPVVEATATPV
ncbi:MAG: hypothetical protein ACI4WX_10705, partial [Aristaeellaceae bacterium]